MMMMMIMMMSYRLTSKNEGNEPTHTSAAPKDEAGQDDVNDKGLNLLVNNRWWLDNGDRLRLPMPWRLIITGRSRLLRVATWLLVLLRIRRN